MQNKIPSQFKLYSPKTRGFYDRDIHGKNIPLDVVQITNARWRELLDANAEGMDIVPDEHGFPQARPHAMTEEERKATLPFRRAVALRRVSELIERHRDELALGKATTLSTEEHMQLVAHRAAVRDATDEVPEPPALLAAKKGA